MNPYTPQLPCIIIDDNEIDREAIAEKAARNNLLNVCGIFDNAIEAKGTIDKYEKILLLLDIDMPHVSGLDLLKALTNRPVAVFITSHPEYALDAYEHYALDYLLKPVTTERFDKCVQRAAEYAAIQDKARMYDIYFGEDVLLIKEGYETVRLRASDIFYLEALKDYTKIITRDKTYLTLANLKTFSERLPQKIFLRVHRSYTVSIGHIKKFDGHELWINDINIPIGKTYRHEVGKIAQNLSV